MVLGLNLGPHAEPLLSLFINFCQFLVSLLFPGTLPPPAYLVVTKFSSLEGSFFPHLHQILTIFKIYSEYIVQENLLTFLPYVSYLVSCDCLQLAWFTLLLLFIFLLWGWTPFDKLFPEPMFLLSFALISLSLFRWTFQDPPLKQGFIFLILLALAPKTVQRRVGDQYVFVEWTIAV